MRQVTRAAPSVSGSDPGAIHSGDSATGADIAAGSTYPTGLVVANAAISNAKLANMATNRVKIRGTAGTGAPEDGVPTNLYLGNATIMGRSDRTKRWSGGAVIASNADIPWLPWHTSTTLTLAAATVYLMKIPLGGSGTSTFSITNVNAYLNTKAASTLTHCFAGLVSSAGAQLGISADNASANQNWSTTGAAGYKTHPLVGGPITVTPTGIDDFVYACLYMGTTAGVAPLFQASAAATAPLAFLNFNLAAAASLMGTIAVADTATPFSALTLSSITATSQAIWLGVS